MAANEQEKESREKRLFYFSVKKVLSPFGIRVPDHSHNVTAGMQVEGTRLAKEFHAGLIRHLVPFAAVTGMAAGNQIFPG